MKAMNEQDRQLSSAERRRLERFKEISREYEISGFSMHALTVSAVQANVQGILMAVPFCIVEILLFVAFIGLPLLELWLEPIAVAGVLIAYLALIVVHELLHGIVWGAFAKQHFADIEFGFIKEYLTPYCTCKCPLAKTSYIVGALAPLIVLGILPALVSIPLQSLPLLFVAVLLTLSAGGDILVVVQILRYKSKASEVFYLDHPTEIGGVIFEH